VSEEKLFEIFLNHLNFDITEYLIPEGIAELNDFQKKSIEDATILLKDNIIGDVKKIGANFKKNEQKFKDFEKKAEDELMQEKYKSIKKALKDFLKDYLKNLRKLIERTCLAIIPVKEMPWVDVIFRTIPRIVIEKKKCKLFEEGIAYYGEIKCVISRTTIYGKMKGVDPLFAPIMGEMDLGGFKLDENQKAPKAQIYPFVSTIINSFDSTVNKSQLAKYHEGYQRHGEPICDFLMKDEDLMKVMAKLTSGIESKRINGDVAICGIAFPLSDDNTTLIIVTEEAKDNDKYLKAFEATLRFSAACCEAPSTRKALDEQKAQEMTQAARAQQGPSGPGVGGLVAPPSQAAQPGGSIRTPGGQNLQVWSAEELQKAAQERGTGGVPPNMETWSEEDLKKMAKERGSGIPEGMEVWTEEDLEELKKERQGGGLNIPEWKVDEVLPECSKCGYTLRKGWSECPICNTPVGAAPSPATSTSTAEKKDETPKHDDQKPSENMEPIDMRDESTKEKKSEENTKN